MSVPYLAKYDFRTKQQYIYRTNKIREIAGASSYIACSYHRFLERLNKGGMKVELNYTWNSCAYVNDEDDNKAFNPSFEGTDFVGKVLYVGGGNLIVLWKDLETAKKANAEFCKMLLDEAPGLSLICGLAEYSGDYAENYKALQASFENDKRLHLPMVSEAMLPFSEIDRRTSLPIVFKGVIHGKQMSLSAESLSKQNNYDKPCIHPKDESTNDLDAMITQKGQESLLAIIYIDGNGMGDRVRKCMLGENGEEIKDYPKAVRRIRKFSNSIHHDYVSAPMERIFDYLDDEKHKSDHRNALYRQVIANGDEVTIICNARIALDVTREYFAALKEANAENSSCAGIAIFHSHAPFATIYSLAEECCENAKKLNRKNGNGNCLVDFQYCYSGITGDLENMREQDKDRINRPYCICKGDNISDAPCMLLDDFIACGRKLSAIGRSNVKDLAKALVYGQAEYLQEYYRIRAHIKDGAAFELDDKEKKMLFDVAQFYDLWFAGEV